MINLKNNRLILIIVLIGFILRVYGLIEQPLSTDDRAVVYSAYNYVERGHLGPTMWNHPHFRDLMVYTFTDLFAGNELAGKIPSVVFGTLTILLLYLVTNKLINNTRVALLTAFLLAIDPFHIDFSRQAVHDVYMPFFVLGGIYMALRFQDNSKALLLVVSGLFFGFGIASKWYVLLALFVTFFYLIYVNYEKTELSDKHSRGLLIVLSLVVIPFIVYILTFIPWFKRGYDISDWFLLQRSMYHETMTHQGYNEYTLQRPNRSASQWFVQPVAFIDLVGDSEKVRPLIAVTNPLVWLLAIPAVVFTAYRGLRVKSKKHMLISSFLIASYVPFLFAGRPIWSNSIFAVMPFVFIMVAYFISNVLKTKQFLYIYIAIVCLTTFPLYLLAIGKGMEFQMLQPIVDFYRQY